MRLLLVARIKTDTGIRKLLVVKEENEKIKPQFEEGLKEKPRE